MAFTDTPTLPSSFLVLCPGNKMLRASSYLTRIRRKTSGDGVRSHFYPKTEAEGKNEIIPPLGGHQLTSVFIQSYWSVVRRLS